jgi:hypothetical protein
MVFAREDGSLDWLANVASSSRDYGYQQYLTSVDATLMSVRDMTSLLSGGFLYHATVLCMRSSHYQTLNLQICLLQSG